MSNVASFESNLKLMKLTAKAENSVAQSVLGYRATTTVAFPTW